MRLIYAVTEIVITLGILKRKVEPITSKIKLKMKLPLVFEAKLLLILQALKVFLFEKKLKSGRLIYGLMEKRNTLAHMVHLKMLLRHTTYKPRLYGMIVF